MGIYLAEQTRFFLEAILLGASVGLLYDALRITRIAIPTAAVVVAVEDILYFLLLGICTFFFLMRSIDGQVRFFILIGEGIGAILYFLSFSILVMRISGAVIGAAKAVVRFFVRWIFKPIVRFVYAIVLLILRPLRFLLKFFKKFAQRCKYRLKVRRKVLYNQLRSAYASKKPKKQRKNRSHGQEKNPGSQEYSS